MNSNRSLQTWNQPRHTELARDVDSICRLRLQFLDFWQAARTGALAQNQGTQLEGDDMDVRSRIEAPEEKPIGTK